MVGSYLARWIAFLIIGFHRLIPMKEAWAVHCFLFSNLVMLMVKLVTFLEERDMPAHLGDLITCLFCKWLVVVYDFYGLVYCGLLWVEWNSNAVDFISLLSDSAMVALAPLIAQFESFLWIILAFLLKYFTFTSQIGNESPPWMMWLVILGLLCVQELLVMMCCLQFSSALTALFLSSTTWQWEITHAS